jgi:non-ribosomal peptide synthetase component E (peptide arylation enzyme)
MVEVNATIFIQMAHFLIAWFFLNKYLLRPIVAFINKEKAAIEGYEQTLEKESLIIEQEISAQKKFWKNQHTQLQKESPACNAHTVLSYSAIVCPIIPEMNKSDKELLIERTKKAIVKQVKHD